MPIPYAWAIRLALVAALVSGAWWHGYKFRERTLQAEWDADKLVQQQALAEQQAQVIETERAHAALADHYNAAWTHDLPAIRARWMRDSEADTAALIRHLSTTAAASRPADAATSNDVPADAFRRLAADCAVTTEQLVRLQGWAGQR